MDDVRQAVLMTEIASSDRLWTRAAVRGGRIFVCFPRWFADEHVPVSVGELVSPGRVKPYPDDTWNSWRRGALLGNRFICVQSVYFDDEGYLWVLDTANPTDLTTGKHGKKVLGDGPKLYKFDVRTDKCIDTYGFGEGIYRDGSYFNDVRICTERQKAFLTDSGLGALIVLDLRTGVSRRLLDGCESVMAEDFQLEIEGYGPWLDKDGNRQEVHSDGIALSPDRRYVYYKALTGRTLWRISIDSLLNGSNLKPEKVGTTSATDGIQFGADGHLYLTDIELNAITRLADPYKEGTKEDGLVQIVISGKDWEWPDSITRATDGSLYITTTRIHHQKGPKEPPSGAFKLFRLQIGKLGVGPFKVRPSTSVY